MQSVSFTEQNKHVIKIVEKRKKIQVGDYCVFQCLDHDIRGKVHSRAIPGSWKKRRVFSKGSQDSPPGSLG
jgi:hypothetical protein